MSKQYCIRITKIVDVTMEIIFVIVVAKENGGSLIHGRLGAKFVLWNSIPLRSYLVFLCWVERAVICAIEIIPMPNQILPG